MKKSGQSGFTLVELMVVIVIIGVLVAVVMPKFANAIAKARASEIPHTLKIITSAQEMCYAETGDYKDNCGWGPSTTQARITAGENLGISMRPNGYFRYSSDATNAGYNVNAILVKDLGKAKQGQKVKVTQDNERSLIPKTTTSGLAMASFLRGYLK